MAPRLAPTLICPDAYMRPSGRFGMNQSRALVATQPSTPRIPQRSLRLAALPTAPHLARVFVTHAARQLQLSSECAETAELIMSELVTNAVKQVGRVTGP